MGNWHCIPSSCAEVVYQEYLPPVVRWRYPDEDWQEIKADNFTLSQDKGKCPTKYHSYGSFYSKNLSNVGCNITAYWRTARALTGLEVENWQPVNDGGRWKIQLKNGTFEGLVYHDKVDKRPISLIDRSPQTFTFTRRTVACANTTSSINADEVKLLEIIRVDGLPDNCGDCTFTVTKNGVIVHQEIRSVCPEVEKLPCRLSDEIKQIEIEKFPYLERAEVVPYAYKNLGLNVFQAIIPDECLNIYKNTTVTVIPQFEGFPTPSNTDQAAYGYITQICSAPGCPPPEYQVLCDSCGCENCPPGTRAVTCGNSVCCYGTDGVSVLEIPTSDYCGGEDCE